MADHHSSPVSNDTVDNGVDDTKDEILITHDPLDVNAAFLSATEPSTGATSIFVGTTRDNFDGKKVLKLEYEAYEPMAVKQLKSLCSEVRRQWSVTRIVVHHRLGEVAVTQPSVVIAISSPHRQESLQAVNYAIDRLKETVPIWKKEKYEDGEEEWKENKECCWKSKDHVGIKRARIDPSQVQVLVSGAELERRMAAFIQRKREENDRNNILEFCYRLNSSAEEGCARVDSCVVRKEGSKSHLRTSTVESLEPKSADETGNSEPPQAATRSHSEVDSSHFGAKNTWHPLVPGPLNTRVTELEEKVLRENCPVPATLYQRLKQLEDRIVYLEGLSPEYSHLTTPVQSHSAASSKPHQSYFDTVVGMELDIRLRKRDGWKREMVLKQLGRVDSKIHELRARLRNNKNGGR